MDLRRVVLPLLALMALGLLVWTNHLVFPFFDRQYLSWYLQSGALIGVITAVFSAAWGDMDKNTGLISANPLDYVRGCLNLVSLPLISIGTQVTGMGERVERGTKDPNPPDGWFLLDVIIMLPVLFVVSILLLAWLLIIAPMQYFLFLIAGALPRSLMRSPTRMVAHRNFGSYETGEIARDADIPKDWWDASLTSRPVALTAGLSSLLTIFLRTLV
jgi:hypothetical protein